MSKILGQLWPLSLPNTLGMMLNISWIWKNICFISASTNIWFADVLLSLTQAILFFSLFVASTVIVVLGLKVVLSTNYVLSDGKKIFKAML